MTSIATATKQKKVIGIILVIITGLLNFHPPHFLIEKHKNLGSTSPILEFDLFILVIVAIVSAFGIYKNMRWGWVLGISVSCISIVLWIAQETIGLPGLPKMWFEPSRIVALIIEVTFIILAYQVIASTNKQKTAT